MKKETIKLLWLVKEHIEKTEELIDGEFGHCRTAGQIAGDGDMPEIYNMVLDALHKEMYSDET